MFIVVVILSAFMGHPIMSGDKGFTYPVALFLIIIVSSSLMVAQKQWSTIVKRENEKELLFRAGQIVKGIESFYTNFPKGSSVQYPRTLKVLLIDNRYPVVKRHLRKIYNDPMTKDGDWGIVYDGKGNIKGVYSKSNSEPLKKDGFPNEYKTFKNKKKYSDWKFVYEYKKETAS